MALYMLEFLKSKQNVLHRGKSFVDLSAVIKRLLKRNDGGLERKESREPVEYSSEIIHGSPQGRKWYDGKSVKDLPRYLYWPSEKRYGKVLWWGYGRGGLWFIEKGRGYVYPESKEKFIPAEEKDYLEFLRSTAE